MIRSIRLYIYGCQTCGTNSVYVRRLKANCLQNGLDLEVKNTKYDSGALKEHGAYLGGLGLSSDNYPALVVDDDTATILKDWL